MKERNKVRCLICGDLVDTKTMMIHNIVCKKERPLSKEG